MKGLSDAKNSPRSTPQLPLPRRHPHPGSQPKSPVSILMMATTHELEALRVLLESALIQVQMPAHQPRTQH